MKKVYIILVLLVFFSTSFALNANAVDYMSAQRKGDWFETTLWSQNVVPNPATLQANFKITVSSGADITHSGNMTLTTKGDLIVSGILVIDGDLILDANNPTNITINAGGVLIITGNFNAEDNNTSVVSGGYLVVGVNYNHTGNGTSSITNPENIFTLGEINSTLTGSGDINEGEETLRTENPTLFDFIKNRAPFILPVNLLYFKGTTKNQSVEINWASSKAWDFSHYELERSADGVAFDFVATIDAAEFSNETIEYTYSDRQPLSGTSYYRLKAVDIDGAFEYKDMAAVKFGAESFKVYPNPSANGFINLDWSHAVDGATVVLRDHAGRTVLTTSLTGNKNTISTAGLNPGIYLLSILGPAGSKQAQVMIK